MTVVLDTKLGNTGSIRNMLEKLRQPCVVSADPGQVRDADRLILPGVGTYRAGMDQLRARELAELATDLAINQKTPVLGICLGMQLMADWGEEGDCPGLGWIPGRVERIDLGSAPLKLPHMGWNFVTFSDPELAALYPEPPRFYFVHSFRYVNSDSSYVAATCRYGSEFACVIRKGHLLGTQFHPEKSLHWGLTLLSHFCTWQRV